MRLMLAGNSAKVSSNYKRIGHFEHYVRVLPRSAQVVSAKSMSLFDEVHELESSFCISIDPMMAFRDEDILLQPDGLFKNENNDMFVDAKYEYQIGQLILSVYFFMPISQCSFVIYDKDTDSIAMTTTLEKLWESGEVKKL